MNRYQTSKDIDIRKVNLCWNHINCKTNWKFREITFDLRHDIWWFEGKSATTCLFWCPNQYENIFKISLTKITCEYYDYDFKQLDDKLKILLRLISRKTDDVHVVFKRMLKCEYQKMVEARPMKTNKELESFPTLFSEQCIKKWITECEKTDLAYYI